MTRTLLAAALVLMTLPAPPVRAQKPVFSSGAVAVRIDAQVTQGKRPVPGLTAADFEVLDNGVPQRVSLVDSDEIPINVVLALDLGDAVAPIRTLQSIRQDPERGTDPWWHYRLGPGIWADGLWTQTIAMLEAR